MISWRGSLVYHGGKARDKECPSCYWKPLTYGIYASLIKNAFPKHVYGLCRRIIHLVGNSASRPKKGTANYDHIFKCRKLIEQIINKMNILWIAGKWVCINEIIILYTGRAITFGHYMPLKPINHVIKVFILTFKSHTLV